MRPNIPKAVVVVVIHTNLLFTLTETMLTFRLYLYTIAIIVVCGNDRFKFNGCITVITFIAIGWQWSPTCPSRNGSTMNRMTTSNRIHLFFDSLWFLMFERLSPIFYYHDASHSYILFYQIDDCRKQKVVH